MLATIYTGETLWPGQLGHAFILISFLSCLFTAFSYYKDTKQPDQGWKNIARGGWYLHAFSVFGILATIFSLMSLKMYEYKYVQEHVSDDLPYEYIFSAFWEGQEGSFLLWMFWHVILGIILIRKNYKIESFMMPIFVLVQAFIASMILGIYVGFGESMVKIGSNPLLLLRDTMNIPLFQNPDYLSLIEGRGLNPLLQNYWNVIHPPTLFLGFASVTVPFSFVLGGFWKKDLKSWVEPVLNWALFSACILGTGILMGSAWAYVALSFGGYWAWDPVENMSLVPWIILVGGLHTNIIAKVTGRAIKSTYFMYALSFVMILYSTFLTRSGVLGETSAHAFTEMGLEWQLVAFVLFFGLLSKLIFLANHKHVPKLANEESIYSREFWMYIGSIVLLFSAVIIAASTSLPVVNLIGKYFDPTYIGRVIDEPITHFNKYQLWIACFVSVLSSGALWMRYKAFGWEKQRKKFAISFMVLLAISVLICYLMSFWISYFEPRYAILTTLAIFGVLANLYVLFPKNWKSTKALASATSHLGFGVMVIGTIASGLNEGVISTNPFAMKGLMEDDELGKVVGLIKGEPMFCNGYWITYESDTITDRYRYFDINFRQVDNQNNTVDEFNVEPHVLFSNDLRKIASINPSTKHYIHKDIFTNIRSLPESQIDVEKAQAAEDSLKYKEHILSIGDTVNFKNCYGVLETINYTPSNKNYSKEDHELGVQVNMKFHPTLKDSLKEEDKNKIYPVDPALGLAENLVYTYPVTIDQLGVKVKVEDTFFADVFTVDGELKYQSFEIPQGGSFEFGDYNVSFTNVIKDPTHKNYQFEEGDLPIGANLIITHKDGTLNRTVTPLYIIRNSIPFTVKEYLPQEGIHIRFANIDPTTGKFTFKIASDSRDNIQIPLLIAEGVPRTDVIYLEAKVFPGINLFWLGSILMMLGFILAIMARKKAKS